VINQNHDAINYCENCDVEYVAPASVPCPLCPLQEAFNAACVRISLTEPFNLLTATEDWEIEQLINGAVAADDWFLTKFRLACAVREGTWQTIYAALLQREGYDQERHRAAIQARREARNAHREKREQIQREVAVVKARRSQHRNACS
jgi:hypothetical protein